MSVDFKKDIKNLKKDIKHIEKTLGEFDGYRYDKNGNYYKWVKTPVNDVAKEENYMKITKQEYMDATGESSFVIDKLKNSVYPDQIRDYVFLRFPDFEKESGKYAPADWMLTNLIKLLWKEGIHVGGWDQGHDVTIQRNKEKIRYHEPAFITTGPPIKKKTRTVKEKKKQTTEEKKKCLDNCESLIKIFGEENVIILEEDGLIEERKIRRLGRDKRLINTKEKKDFLIQERKERKKLADKENMKYPKKIRIRTYNSRPSAIVFNHLFIPYIYAHLGLKMVDKDRIHKGNRLRRDL